MWHDMAKEKEYYIGQLYGEKQIVSYFSCYKFQNLKNLHNQWTVVNTNMRPVHEK